MSIDNLTIGEAKQLAAMFANANASSRIQGNGRPVIVRSRDAGVQFGYLESYEGSTVHLRNARQMWSWTAAEGGTLPSNESAAFCLTCAAGSAAATLRL